MQRFMARDVISVEISDDEFARIEEYLKHSAENIVAKAKEICEQWNLKFDMIEWTTDGAGKHFLTEIKYIYERIC